MLKRYPNNPIITPEMIPDIYPQIVDATSVFNSGAIKFNDKYVLLLRVQNRGRQTFMLYAESTDGYNFTITPKIIQWQGLERLSTQPYHIYDPRIHQINDKYFIMFAMDFAHGCELGLGITEDFVNYRFLGIISNGDYRNGVLFPHRIKGEYLRYDRPNRNTLNNTAATGSEIWLSRSPDLLHWQPVAPVIAGRPHYWDEMIGAGPPPIKTRQGWLQIYHGIAVHLASIYIYQTGVFLADLENPAQVISRSTCNILEPRKLYELTGQVPNVCFPCGLIVEESDDEGFALPHSEVKIYYGAADTVLALATTTIGELIEDSQN
ncbi:MAG: glycoside hydrolase family 130 protein [Candidatus Cloacimonetes bacterium]|nr:glycoside hydrolase family 130 protein [Candidatus Cloacimonadota bacterium]